MTPVLLLLLLTQSFAALLTEAPSFADRIDKLYEKLEKFNSPDLTNDVTTTPQDKLYEKLDRLNSLTPDKSEITDDDEELLAAMQIWGMLNDDQIGEVMKDIQTMKEFDDKTEKMDVEYDWNDELPDLQDDDVAYASDDWEPVEDEASSTVRPRMGAVAPIALSKLDTVYRQTLVSAIDPIAATNERPKVLVEGPMTVSQRAELRRAAYANMAAVVQSSKCLTPQPRWLSVRQLAPATDIVYMPPCVKLHRCAPDSGCCYSETQVCAPVAGEYVNIPFYLNKPDGTLSLARMRFFNHTSCQCVSKETLQSSVRMRINRPERPERNVINTNKEASVPSVTTVTNEVKSSTAAQNVAHTVSNGRNVIGTVGNARQSDWKASVTEEPVLEKDEEATAPPLLRRCTCPTLFLARPTDSTCSCVCSWSDLTRKRDCLSLARGREHFGLRDRVCIDNGDCNPPSCEYGTYDRNIGRCPMRRYSRRIRYHARSRIAIPAV